MKWWTVVIIMVASAIPVGALFYYFERRNGYVGQFNREETGTAADENV